jgi:hypothetical protein
MAIRFETRPLMLLACGLAFLLAAKSTTSAPATPNPQLYLTRTEVFEQGSKTFIRYRYDVFNKDQYPAAMFAAAPALPPCGLNTTASRTWVDVFDPNGKRLNRFCAFGSPNDLGSIWFALEQGVVPPSYVFIVLTDRKTSVKYKSNLADTTS